MFNKFNTHSLSNEKAFEVFSNQIFENLVREKHSDLLRNIFVFNGNGSDGGVEAIAELENEVIIGCQAKWFRSTLESGELGQIKLSLEKAIDSFPNLKEYYIFIPHYISDSNPGRKRKTEAHRIKELEQKFPKITFVWFDENKFLEAFQISENQSIEHYWFDNYLFKFDKLKKRFEEQKLGWLKERYISEYLFTEDIIGQEFNKQAFSEEYRKKLIENYIEIINVLKKCIENINFLNENHTKNRIFKLRLLVLKRNFQCFYLEFEKCIEQIRNGNSNLKPKLIKEVWISRTREILKKTYPQNFLKNTFQELIDDLDYIHKSSLEDELNRLSKPNYPKSSMFYGQPGSGKTTGLTKLIEKNLSQSIPSIIIRAKGAKNESWSKLLNHELDLPTWDADDIITALNALAILNDHKKIKNSNYQDFEPTPIYICIDGLEEDYGNYEKWYEIINQRNIYLKKYPRLIIHFTARPYFYDNQKNIPILSSFNIESKEINFRNAIQKYFQQYNIRISSSPHSIKFESFYQLKLFCQVYKNKEFNPIENSFDLREMLNLKIRIINDEFYERYYPTRPKGQSNQEIKKFIEKVVTNFYGKLEVNRDELTKLFSAEFSDITQFQNQMIDLLIEYGIIGWEKRLRPSRIFGQVPEDYYSIYDEVLIDIIVSNFIFEEIKNRLNPTIPSFLLNPKNKNFTPMGPPMLFTPKVSFTTSRINEKVKKLILLLFNYNGKLIGLDDYLTEGFHAFQIEEAQFFCLVNGKVENTSKYHDYVKTIMKSSTSNLYEIVKNIIIPSTEVKDSYFGAIFFHEFQKQFTVWERDKLWSGLDRHELHTIVKEEERNSYLYRINLSKALKSNYYNEEYIHINEDEQFNQKPLIFTWALSSIDSELRESIKGTISRWAIANIEEFIKLLNVFKDFNDPQILEELAIIFYGVTSSISQKRELLKLFNWLKSNTFLLNYPNIVIRAGFSFLTEKAFKMNLTPKLVKNTLSRKNKEIEKLNIEVWGNGTQYPFCEDLGWYVLKKSCEINCLNDRIGRLEFDFKMLFSVYPEINDIGEFIWSASLYYLKNLGFDRIEGNNSKDRSHGFRSKVFTYEEKYTWLSVNYLKAYFIDNFSVINESRKKISLPSYDYLVDFKNPINPIYHLRNSKTPIKWIINENLAPEVLDMNTESIKKEIVKEPILDYSKWIFTDNGSPVIFHDISLKNSNKTISSHLEITACLVSKNFDKGLLERLLVAKLDNFLERDDFDRLFCSIDSKSEQHPFDILNSFSGREIDTEMKLKEAKNRLIFTITTCKVKSFNDESHYFKLPSEKIRTIFGITQCSENLEYLNSNNEIIIKHYFKNDSKDNQRFDDYQEILTLENESLCESINNHNLELVWLIDYSISKNPHNKELSNFFCQKFRRYICWMENNELQNRKIWDESSKTHKNED